MNGIAIHPTVLTKKMGRPPKNRKKTPKEKNKKDGTIYINKKGVTMHCSVCGSADHNKKGHPKFMREQHEAQLEDDEKTKDPSILQVNSVNCI